MEEYMELETMGENTDMAGFFNTVSGNDAGIDDGKILVPEEIEGDIGQDELLERLDALVEALTPGEEEPEENTDMVIESLPSETETAILELLERIYSETTESYIADTLYYEAWTECQIAVQENVDAQFSYTFVTQIILVFLCAVMTGLLIVNIVWSRFK